MEYCELKKNNYGVCYRFLEQIENRHYWQIADYVYSGLPPTEQDDEVFPCFGLRVVCKFKEWETARESLLTGTKHRTRRWWLSSEEIEQAAEISLSLDSYGTPKGDRLWRRKVHAAMSRAARNVEASGEFTFNAIKAWKEQLEKDAKEVYGFVLAAAVLLFIGLALTASAALHFWAVSSTAIEIVHKLKQENVELRNTIDNLKQIEPIIEEGD
jgi:hypothetical protein